MLCFLFFFFFFNDTATTEIYTLSLHDALPIWRLRSAERNATAETHRNKFSAAGRATAGRDPAAIAGRGRRSEEHTSELQSHVNLVCRLLLEKKKKNKN